MKVRAKGGSGWRKVRNDKVHEWYLLHVLTVFVARTG